MNSGAPNTLILQSGGGTPVLNRSLLGVAAEASNRSQIGGILGARRGIEGLLRDEFVDLDRLSKSAWTRLAAMPAAALGTTRYRPSDDEMVLAVERLREIGVRFCFFIGGNDSAGSAHRLGAAARTAGLPLSIIHVPKTIDNDLVLTDHTPGYGSAARFVALATLGAGLDAEAMGAESPITIIEVMGRDAGWLAASAVLAKREERDAPHVLGLPETPVDEDRFCELVEAAYSRFGFAVAVVSEKARGHKGALGGDDEPLYVDSFGHPYYDGPARYLASLVSRRLSVRVRDEKPGTIQRSFIPSVSHVDAREAEAAGRAAVVQAVEGRTDCMVTLVRQAGDQYACTTGSAALEQVAGQVRPMPVEYLDADICFVTDAFADYARPLIGRPLPRPARVN